MGFANEHRAKEQSAAEHKAQEYEALRESVEALRKEIRVLDKKIDKQAELSDQVVSMDDEDRQLILNVNDRLGNVQRDVRTANENHKVMALAVVVCTIASIMISFWTQAKTRNYMEQIETDYRSTKAILSGDEHYWFNGENFRMGQESPTGEEYRQISEKVQQAKAEREQAGENQ